jgi:NhaP-type Na+/H+ or K+/H+ antiporter
MAAAAASGGTWEPRVRLAILGTMLGASLGAVAAYVARRAERPSGTDGTAVTVGMSLGAIASTALAAWLGAAALGPIAAAAALLSASTARLLARRERRVESAARIPWGDA